MNRRTLLRTAGGASLAALAGCADDDGDADTPVYVANRTAEAREVDAAVSMVDVPDDRDYEKVITVEPGETIRAFRVHTSEFCLGAVVHGLTDEADGIAHVCLSPDGNSAGGSGDRGIVSMRDPSDFSEIGYLLALRSEPLNDDPHSSIELVPIHRPPDQRSN